MALVMNVIKVKQNDNVLKWADDNLVTGKIPDWTINALSTEGEEEYVFMQRLVLNKLFQSRGMSGEATKAIDLYEVGFWQSLQNISHPSSMRPMLKRLKVIVEQHVGTSIDGRLNSKHNADETHPWVSEYKRHLASKGRDKRTIREQSRIALFFIRWLRNLSKFQSMPNGELNLYALQHEDIKLFLQYLRRMHYSGEMAETTASQVSVISLSFIRFCMQKHGLQDVLGNLKGLGQGDTIDWWIPVQTEIKQFFLTIFRYSSRSVENFALFGLMYMMGLRPGEALGLRWDGVILEDNIIEFRGKGGHTVSMSLVSPLSKALAVLQKEEKHGDLVFTGKKGKKLSHFQMIMRFRTFATISGWTEESWPKTFRHAFCTHMLLQTSDYLLVNRLARHTKLETTQRYVHFTNQHLQHAAGQIHENMTFIF